MSLVIPHENQDWCCWVRWKGSPGVFLRISQFLHRAPSPPLRQDQGIPTFHTPPAMPSCPDGVENLTEGRVFSSSGCLTGTTIVHPALAEPGTSSPWWVRLTASADPLPSTCFSLQVFHLCLSSQVRSETFPRLNSLFSGVPYRDWHRVLKGPQIIPLGH